MEVPRLGVQSELQLPAYTTATVKPHLSCVCDLHHSSRQQPIPNPLSEARDRTRNLMVPSWICFHCSITGTPSGLSLLNLHIFWSSLQVVQCWLTEVNQQRSKPKSRKGATAAQFHQVHEHRPRTTISSVLPRKLEIQIIYYEPVKSLDHCASQRNLICRINWAPTYSSLALVEWLSFSKCSSQGNKGA